MDTGGKWDQGEHIFSWGPTVPLYNVLCWMLEKEMLSLPSLPKNQRMIVKFVVIAVYIWTTWDRAINRVLSIRP